MFIKMIAAAFLTAFIAAVFDGDAGAEPSSSAPAAKSEATAKPNSYVLTVTRGGKKETRVAVNFWSGEYPSPVIDVRSLAPGELAVPAVKSLRDSSGPVSCTISHGLYHPWSKTKSSVLDFYQIIPLIEYQTLRPATVGGRQLKKGDKISRLVYLAEGSCQGVVLLPRKKEVVVDFPCEEVNEAQGMKLLSQAERDLEEQWLHLSCKEGYKAFIRDEDLLAQPGVRQGEVEKYGVVRSAAAPRQP